MAKKPKRGRPSSYTRATADVICMRLAEGETLTAICKEPQMPGMATVFRWLERRLDFRERYARARIRQAEVIAEQSVLIADEATSTSQDPKRLNAEATRQRTRVQARQWFAEHVTPKKYALELANADGNPLQFKIHDADVEALIRLFESTDAEEITERNGDSPRTNGASQGAHTPQSDS